ncbi:MAG: SoxR reducing system RseC family protein [Bacteroidota bacterium]|nr:SoxR reducing system RseC family protein [Bacteroidota bacterium]
MKGEDIYEEGIVLNSVDGTATVMVMDSESCHECGARMFCSAADGRENTVTVHDPFGAHAGDAVRFVIRGEIMFKAAALLYGIPLALILGGVLVGMYMFDPGLMPRELWSFLLGLFAAGLYYLMFFFSGSGARSGSMMPSIVYVRAAADTAHDGTTPG